MRLRLADTGRGADVRTRAERACGVQHSTPASEGPLIDVPQALCPLIVAKDVQLYGDIFRVFVNTTECGGPPVR